MIYGGDNLNPFVLPVQPERFVFVRHGYVGIPAIVAESTLATISLSSTTYTSGTASNGTITGATAGSSIVATNVPTGFTINSAARTWAYDGTGSTSTGSLTLTETLAGATGSPKATVIGYTVAAAAVSPPAFSVAPVITGTAQEGQTLTTTNGTASNSPTYARQWKRGGVAISGATGTTYVLVTADVGSTITVTSTATNAGGSATSTSAATASVAAAAGTALSAPTLTRTSTVLAYPPTVSFTRPIDWADTPTMYAVMQWSTDPTFATFTETATPQVITAAVTSYNFGLSAITSGVYYMRLGAWTGTRPGSLNWSNIQGVGDAVAPTITSSAAPSGYQYVAGSITLTANKGATWELVGGTGFLQFSLAGNVLSYLAQSSVGSLEAIVRATSYFGVDSIDQTIALSIALNTANAFTFTDEADVAVSTSKTSNEITVTIPSGSSLAVTGGPYIKTPLATGVAGAASSAGTTAVTGDKFKMSILSSASYSTSVNAPLTIGSTSDTYTVTTLADPAKASFSLQYTSPELNGGFGPSVTQTGITLAAGNYDIVVATGWNRPSAVSWNGVGATLAAQSETTDQSRASISSWRLTVATGATGSVVVTATATDKVVFAIIKKSNSLASPSSTSKLANSSYSFAHTPDTTLTIPSPKGSAYAAINHNGNSVTWDSGTELLDVRTTNLGFSIITNSDADPVATTDAGGAQRCMVALAYDGI